MARAWRWCGAGLGAGWILGLWSEYWAHLLLGVPAGIFLLYALLSREWPSAVRSLVVGMVVWTPLAYLAAYDLLPGPVWLAWFLVAAWHGLLFTAQSAAARYVEGPVRPRHRAAFAGALAGHLVYWAWALLIWALAVDTAGKGLAFLHLFVFVVLPSSMLGAIGATIAAASRRRAL